MRQFNGKLAIILGIWAIITAVFHLYTAYYGSFEPRFQRATHVMLLLPIAFLVFPGKRYQKSELPSVFDWILAVLALLPSLYLMIQSDSLARRVELVDPVTTVQLILGIMIVLLVIEACRRAVSSIFAGLITLLLLYMFAAPYLPGPLKAKAYSVDQVTELMFLSADQGIYGFLTGIGATIIFVFILFAAIMIRSGVGQFFMDISVMIAGKYRGGPAKVAVLSSGLYGSISGSGVADVYSTGSFTVPLMKKVGYNKTSSGAIEAVASAGGPFLPPIMGAGAFIMAEITSTSYLIVIQAAILAGILYYIGVTTTVHFEAVKNDIKSAPIEWSVGWKSIFKRLPLIIPFIIMVWLLIGGISPAKASATSIVAMLIIWIIVSGKKFKVTTLIRALEYATKSGAVIAAALAGAGMMVAVVNQTGLALSLGNLITKYSFGVLGIALVLVMITVIVLGAGIPATPSYIITATVAVGALSAFDIPLLYVHLFIYYFAILADITPPVGVTAFAAANIAGSPPLKTALFSVKYAFAGFVVPYIFIANPALLLGQGDYALSETLLVFVLTAIAIVGLGAAVIGAFFERISWMKRLVLAILSIGIVSGTTYISIICLGLQIVHIAIMYIQYRKDKNNVTENDLAVKAIQE
ncbi:TRAP transporter permease [Virgibacillus sp. W0181]|uniref:TRAP transporter permease n=1 Tax=Virgibacillus sp. W0181 TaxID=3391581 RepID=UPI003F48F30B